MKRFLLISASLFVFAAIVVVALWWFVQSSTFSAEPAATDVEFTTLTPASVAPAEEVTATSEPATAAASDLPISAEQRAAAEQLGIDVDSFQITPEMIACATEAVGEARLAELSAGAEPSFGELFSLGSCLKQ